MGLTIGLTVTYSIRLSEPSAYRPQLLKVTLTSSTDARNALCQAKTLRNSKHAVIRDHVFINPDLTHEQRLLQYYLRTELKHCKAAGETSLIIKHNRIVTKSTHSSLLHRLIRSPCNTHLMYQHRRHALPKRLARTPLFRYLYNYFQTFTLPSYESFACCVINVSACVCGEQLLVCCYNTLTYGLLGKHTFVTW